MGLLTAAAVTYEFVLVCSPNWIRFMFEIDSGSDCMVETEKVCMIWGVAMLLEI